MKNAKSSLTGSSRRRDAGAAIAIAVVAGLVPAAGCGDVGVAGPIAEPAPTPIVMTEKALSVLAEGNYDDHGWLKWDDAGGKRGGNQLPTDDKVEIWVNEIGYTRVGTGQCVDLVKLLSGRTGATSGWVKGPRVVDECTSISLGTAIATFAGSRYAGHAGFLCGCDGSSITLCDQNYVAPGLVGRHVLTTKGTTRVNDASAYYVVSSSR